jgi:Putative MetA-pathway of phenol degradation
VSKLRVILFSAGGAPLLAGAFCSAQLASVTSPCPTQLLQTNPAKSQDLVCAVPQVYGAGGLVGVTDGGPLDDTQGHEVHFQSSSVRSFEPINSEIGVQLSQLPIAAPVAGFVFAGGLVTPTTSFGPVLTDRAETLGKGKIYVSLSYQYFNFDKADGVNLKNFGAVFAHEPEPDSCSQPGPPPCVNGEPVYTQDIVATTNRIDLKVNQLTFVSTYGVANKVDVSVAVPILNVHMGVRSTATIFNFEPPPVNHRFAQTADPFNASFSNSGSSFGMGDITLRAKYLALQGETSAVALGVDFRLPTGDANNFLGSGTWGFRPFGIYTARLGRISPHGTVGFLGNGQSSLAGDVTSNPVMKAHLPDVFSYSFGADGTVFSRLGVSADFIGQTLLHEFKIHSTMITDYGGNTHEDISTSTANVNLASIAVGVKVNPTRNLLVTANGLFRVNNAGLHSKPAPLVGISYSF